MRASALACAFAATACASFGLRPPPEPEPEPAAAAREERPSELPEPELTLVGEDDFGVRIVAGSVTCTGALIAEDRVLTAHHCVSARSPAGTIENHDVEPSEVSVELGGEVLPWGEVAVKSIVAPACGFGGGEGDIAVLVLARPVHGVRPRMVELDHAPTKDDSLVAIGFGRCADASDGTYRKRRASSSVRRMQAAYVEVDAAICPGDSGGPVLNEGTGKIVGVVSRSVMDTLEATLGPTELTRLDVFRSVFASAAQVAAGVSQAELPPIECRH